MQNGMFFKMFKTIRKTKTTHFPVPFMSCFYIVLRGRNNKFTRACRCESRRPNVLLSQQFFMSAKMVSVYFTNTILINNTRSLPLKREFTESFLPTLARIYQNKN